MQDNNELLGRIIRLAREPVEPSTGAPERVMGAIRAPRRPRHAALPIPRPSYAVVAAVAVAAFVSGVLVHKTIGPDPARVGAAGAAAQTAVTFVLVAEHAREVAVVGDFNDWAPGVTRLTQQRGGVWSVVVPLLPGRYSYAFIVDGGTWLPDPAAPANAEEDYGRPSSIVFVERGRS